MTYVLGAQHSEPMMIQGSPGWAGDMIVHVLGGPGLWIGPDPVGVKTYRPVDSAPNALLDGVYVTPGDGPTVLPWMGPCYIFHPGAATSTVYGTIQLMGCVR